MKEIVSESPRKLVGSVEGAMKILRYLAQSGVAQGAASIAKNTRLNTSTTFNILKTLQNEKMVAFDNNTKEYSIGLGLLELSIPLIGRSPNDLIRPLLWELADRFRILVAHWMIVPSGGIVLSERIAPDDILRAELKFGTKFPALSGAVGRCVAAYQNTPKAELQALFAELPWQNPPDFEQYWEDVLAARENGYALDLGNLLIGLNTAASIVCDQQGTPRFALSAITIAGQTSDEDLRAAAKALRQACQTIERSIFGG